MLPAQIDSKAYKRILLRSNFDRGRRDQRSLRAQDDDGVEWTVWTVADLAE